MDMNQLVDVQAIAVEHRVAEGFAKREFDVLLLSADAAGFRDKVHEPVHKGRDEARIAPYPGAHFERSASEPGFVPQRLQRLETPNANHVRNLLSPVCSRVSARRRDQPTSLCVRRKLKARQSDKRNPEPRSSRETRGMLPAAE